jgi:hypothetical protein
MKNLSMLFQKINGGTMLNTKESRDTIERLKSYPNLMEKEVESADTFEEALIPEVRKLGKEVMEHWANSQEDTLKETLDDAGELYHSKKNSIGKQLSGE